MKGRVLSFSVQTNSGEISGDDGNRYPFVGGSWQESQPPQRGMYVDFAVADDGQATGIYLALDGGMPTSASGFDVGAPRSQPVGRRPGSKDKTVAGILGILLGGLGIHKFYLGYTGPAILFLLLFIFTCGIAGIITGIIGLIEGIIYLTKSDEEFEAIYVRGRRSFF